MKAIDMPKLKEELRSAFQDELDRAYKFKYVPTGNSLTSIVMRILNDHGKIPVDKAEPVNDNTNQPA